MNTKEVLIAARKKIERPECWTKEQSARDADGRPVRAVSSDAVCWCAIGAALSVGYFRAVGKALDDAAASLGFHSVEPFNDDPNTTHADVLALFDRAIAACEGGA